MVKNLRPPIQFDFDLICIGSGSGGGSAAVMAARNKKKVALIEGSVFGGESPNYSCIPINACLQAVKNFETAKNSFEIGIDTGRVNLDWERAMSFKNRCIKDTGVLESETVFEKCGVNLLNGYAKFIDPWTLSVNRRQITAAKIIIATGSTNLIPSIEGLTEKDFITYKEALQLPKPPNSLFIIGGGTTACSMAEIFNAFNCRTYLAESANNLLPREDPEVGQVLAEIFKNKGIHVLTNSKIIRVTPETGDQKKITVQENGDTKDIIVEKILIASGRLPQTDLNLTAAQVQFDAEGIKVNRYLETTRGHIYAVGDVIGHDMLTHLAAYHSRLALHNMNQSKAKNKTSLDCSAITRYLATSPEVAATGLTEAELKQQHLPYLKSMAPIHDLERSSLSNHQAGFVKLLCTPNKKIIGASIIAPRAAEMIAQVSLAISTGLSTSDLRNNIKAFTTWSEAFNVVCQKIK